MKKQKILETDWIVDIKKDGHYHEVSVCWHENLSCSFGWPRKNKIILFSNGIISAKNIKKIHMIKIAELVQKYLVENNLKPDNL